MNNVLVEVCCGSYTDVFSAAACGADRAELNTDLFHGGLTPSHGQIELACGAGIPVMVMIRPRTGGFCYDASELDVMVHDIRAAKSIGAHGVVFGCLRLNYSGLCVDEDACKRLVDAADGMQTVFHRAFDMLPDSWESALDTIIRIGFTRVLTSGHSRDAVSGASRLRAIISRANGAIEVLPCGKIRSDNAVLIVRETGCTQLHTSGFELWRDKSAEQNSSISFVDGSLPAGGEYRAVSYQTLKYFIDKVRG